MAGREGAGLRGGSGASWRTKAKRTMALKHLRRLATGLEKLVMEEEEERQEVEGKEERKVRLKMIKEGKMKENRVYRRKKRGVKGNKGICG